MVVFKLNFIYKSKQWARFSLWAMVCLPLVKSIYNLSCGQMHLQSKNGQMNS